MESANLSERVEFEAQRVAVVFGIQSFEHNQFDNVLECQGNLEQDSIYWGIDIRDGSLDVLHIQRHNATGQRADAYTIFFEHGRITDIATWNYVTSRCPPRPPLNELMAHALYQLAYEDDERFADLKYLLTAHEKLEFRHSLPHNFWPPKWLNEESETHLT